MLLALSTVLLLLPVSAHAGDWFVLPYVRAAGGHESALIIDPAGAAVIVPGGTFIDLSPALLVRRIGDNGLDFEVGTRATLERFFNDVDRTLYGQVLWADLTRELSRRTRLRVSLTGNYFDDSEQDTLRRLTGGAELGLGYSARRWIIEGFAGGRRVNYSNVEVTDQSGNVSTYAETRWSGGAAGSLAISRVASLRLSLRGQATSSIDSDFDSVAMLADLGFRWKFWRGLDLRANYSRQDRSFTNRAAGLDSDEYKQWGAGLAYTWKNDSSFSVRWSEGRYTDTRGGEAPTDRLELAVSLGPSIFGVSTPAERLRQDALGRRYPAAGLNRQTEDGVLFRVQAPGAAVVEVAGEFNGWGRNKLLLAPVGGGWWELRVPLDPGRYQYVYLIEGEAVVPPESTIKIDDGFGGQNGYLEVFR